MKLGQLTLGELIKILKAQDSNKEVKFGFYCPHSYRGFYDELAFEPTMHTNVGRMLANAESAVGQYFYGWKGGEFKMTEDTPVWIASLGETGEPIGVFALAVMLDISVAAICTDFELNGVFA